jgi:tetratricopeptide (TPR) repeat protein
MRKTPKFLLAALLASASPSWPSAPAVAQTQAGAPEDKAADVKTFEEDAKRQVDEASPKLKAEARIRRLSRQSEERLDESIETLKELIAAAPDDDPDKPDYFMNLADAYWEKSESFFERAYDESLESKIYTAEQGGNAAEANRLKAEQQGYLDQQQQWRSRTVETYKVVATKFPDAPKMDEVLYYLGLHQMLVGDAEGGYQTYVSLVKSRPQSQYVPDALVNIGEYYFNEKNDFETSLAFYDKVIKGYAASSVYGFAMYKSGWCHFNMGDYDLSLNAFLETIRYSDSEQASRLSNRLELKKEAQKDLVRAYSMTGNPEKAVGFFKTIAPDIYLDLATALADMYSSQDKFSDANKLYRYLIKERADSYHVLEYQRKIVNLIYRSQKKAETVKEVQRMLGLYEMVGASAPPEWLKQEKQEVERELRVIATTWHKEGQKPFNADTLQQAANLYREYQRLFPESPYAYDVAMNQAILLKDVQNYREAAEAFDRVVQIDPNGKYSTEAAYFAMFSYYQVLNLQEGALKADDEEGLEPDPMPEMEERMAKACEKYIEVAGTESESAPEAHYAAGRLYYNYNHFDKAIPLLEAVVTRYPTNPNASAAAKLLLSSYNLKHDYKSLEKWAVKLSGTAFATGELQTTITKIRDQADFNKCFDFELAKEYERAGDCFMTYANTYPNTELLDRALFNAAVNFNRAKMVEKALLAHGDLYNRRPNSSLAPRALFAIAEIYRQLAIYSEASTYYEQFAQNHKDHPLTEKALRFASIYRKALGEYDSAIANYQRYLEFFPKSDKAAAVFFDAGLIYESQKDWKSMGAHFERFLAKYSSDPNATQDLILGAHLKIGMSQWERGKQKEAVKEFDTVLNKYQSMAPNVREKLGPGVGFVAEAQFMLGEKVLADAREIKITSGNLDKAFSKKLEVIGAAREAFVQVIKLQQPRWVIAGLNRVGLAYEELAKAIEEAPAPRGLNPEQQDLYREDVIQKAEAIKGKAAEAYRECLNTAKDLQWFNEFSEQAASSLAKVDFSYNFIKEYRERPGAYSVNPARPGHRGVFQAESPEAGEDAKPSPAEGAPKEGKP